MAKEQLTRIALILIDQLRADYKEYFPLCSKILPYSAICDTNSIPTSTEAMHANISTGKYPKDHGLISKSKRKIGKGELELLVDKFMSKELTPLSSLAFKEGYDVICICGKPELASVLGLPAEYALIIQPDPKTDELVINGTNVELKQKIRVFTNLNNYAKLPRDRLPDGTRNRALLNIFKYILGVDTVGSKFLSVLALPSLDAIGHKYGPSSKEIIAHIHFLDENIAELMLRNERTLFILAGDHGCRKTQRYVIESREDDARFVTIYHMEEGVYKNKGCIKFDSEDDFQDICYDGGMLRIWFKNNLAILSEQDAQLLTKYGTIIDLRLKQNENKQLPLEVLDNSRHDNLGDIIVVSNKDATFCKRTWLDPELIERKILKNQDLKEDELPIGEHGTYYAEDRHTLFMSNYDFGKNIFLNLQIREELEKLMSQ